MKHVSFNALVVLMLCVVWMQGLVAHAESAEPKKADLFYRLALYDYYRGDFDQARLNLSLAEQETLFGENTGNQHQYGESESHREALGGKLDVALNRYDNVDEVFDNLLSNPSRSNQKILLSLIPLSHSKGHCQKVLGAVPQLEAASANEKPYLIYAEVSCLVRLDNYSVADINNAESKLLDYVDGMKQYNKADIIWFAYGYYNVAVAAAVIGEASQAERLYSEALKYTGYDAEGRALADKISLSMAFASFNNNRFDFSMDAFAKMRIESPWVDKSLLGYGWSSFNNYKPGIALEAWRQLINLPFKSLAAYEGFIAIPFVLERVNAFSSALKAYQRAIEEYEQVIQQIDDLTQSLTVDKVHEHAFEYVNSEGDDIDPLHPLLVSTYAQHDFRSALEQLGRVALIQDKIADFQGQIAILAEVETSTKKQVPKNDAAMVHENPGAAALAKRLLLLHEQVEQLLLAILESSSQQSDVSQQFKKKYSQYKYLQKTADNHQLDADTERRLARLRAVLFWQLYDQRPEVISQADGLSALLDQLQLLSLRYSDYQSMKKPQYQSVITVAELNRLSQKLASVEQQNKTVLIAVEKDILNRTLSALAKQKETIEIYKQQARIASTRLEEEFYQRGGRQLWR